MARTDVLLGVVPQRQKPSSQVADGSVAGMYGRASRYGDLSVQSLVPTKHLLADEGSYFTAQNPTIGTGVITAGAITSFTDTNALFVIKNNASVASGIRFYLDYLRLIATSATTAVVSVDFLVKIDTINRFPSTAANGTTMTPVNTNGDDNTGSTAVIQAFNNAGAMTIAAASAAARVVGRAHLPTGIIIVGDEYIVQSGASERSSMPGLTAVDATQPRRVVGDFAPIIVGPQQFAVIHRWSLTEAAAVGYEFELGWWER